MTEPDDTQKRQAGREAKMTGDTLALVMGSYEGRFWMAELLARCNTFSPCYRQDGDALGMAWRDGMADIGRFLLAQLDEHAADSYQRMIRERRARIERVREKAEEDRKAQDAALEAGKNALSPLDAMADEQARKYAKPVKKDES